MLASAVCAAVTAGGITVKLKVLTTVVGGVLLSAMVTL